jgi:cardiolipin synthase
MKSKNIPNILSIIRLMLVGVFVYTFFWVDEIVALFVFLTAGATDVIDGYLARRNNWISDLGKILDPVADKTMQCTVLVCLLIKSIIPWWFLAVFFAKEISTLFLSFLVLRKKNFVVVSRWYGKFTVCLFYATIVLSVTLKNYIVGIWTYILYIPALVFGIITVFSYIRDFYKSQAAQNAQENQSQERSAMSADNR